MNTVTMWMPSDAAHLDEVMAGAHAQAATVMRSPDPALVANIDQTTAQMRVHVARAGVDLNDAAQARAFQLGALYVACSLRANTHLEPLAAAQALVAYAARLAQGTP